MKWFGIPISWRIFQFVVVHTVKGIGIVNKAEIDIFLELSCFFHDPADVGNLISGSSAFSKTSLNIRKFTVQYCWSLAWRILSITLLACEMSAVVWYFEHSFAFPFLGIGMKTDLLQSCGHCWASKFADILREALSQNHLSGFEIVQLEFHHLH